MLRISTRIALIVAIATAAVALGLLVWWLVARRRRRQRNATAAPPFRKLTTSDRIIASLVNAVNYDVRSLELARWFVNQLIVEANKSKFACDKNSSTIDFAAIAAKVPQANEITQSEVQNHLRELVEEACKQSATHGDFVSTLNAFGDSAYHPVRGVLTGMHGYSVDSSYTLPQ